MYDSIGVGLQGMKWKELKFNNKPWFYKDEIIIYYVK